MNLLRYLLGIFVLTFATTSLAAIAKSPVEQAFDAYWDAGAIRIKIKKSVYLEFMEESRSSRGELEFSKGLFRLEFAEPDVTKLIFDGKTLWYAEKIPQELGGSWKVSKTKNISSLKGQALFGLLFGKKDVWDKLEQSAKKRRGVDEVLFEYKVKDPSSLGNVVRIEFVIHEARNKLLSLRYWDDLENRTTFEFLSEQRSESPPKSKFQYAPPKGAQIMEL